MFRGALNDKILFEQRLKESEPCGYKEKVLCREERARAKVLRQDHRWCGQLQYKD